MRFVRLYFAGLLSIASLMLLSSCGGGGGGNSAIPENTGSATLTGSVFASSVSGASVTVKNTSGLTIAGPVITAADGTYRVELPAVSFASDLLIETAGGTFTDEASAGQTTAGKMAAYVKGGTLQSGSSVNITPASTIIHCLVTKYRLTPDNAGAVFAAVFGFTDDVSVTPLNAPAAGTDTRAQLAFLRAAAFSQLTKEMGLIPDLQFNLFAAIALDLSDSAPDGMCDNTPVTVNSVCLDDIQGRFAMALAAVQNDTTFNKTGLTADKVGIVPFGKTFLTSSYRVQYVPGMMAAATGKTSFQLKVNRRSDGSPASGLDITLMFQMYMATKNHSTPVAAVTEDSADPGTYNCTVYYLMASGPGMGYWELKATIGSGMSGETAVFYPQVGMPMGSTTVRATLKGQNDTIPDATGPVQRNYFLFNDGGTTTTKFNLFLATKETMMNFPAVFAGTTLHDAADKAWTVNTVALSASTDNITWVDATDAGGGHWTVSDLTGLTEGQAGTIYVKLTVNGEQKTTDGMAPAASNGYASFTVTP